jgi:ADP-heptose:LPS heptosyltransferase
MRVLAIQLKRIGDLVLTTPAIAAWKTAHPHAHLALAVDAGCAALLPLIDGPDAAIVFGKGQGWAPWQQVLAGGFDAVLDFTGTDRSAAIALLSRAHTRATFSWVRRKGWRSLAYGAFAESHVRERHTADHYLDLLGAVGVECEPMAPRLRLPPAAEKSAPFALLHAGSARPEKYWLAERWAAVARHVIRAHRLPVKLSAGPDPAERAHVREILDAAGDASTAIEIVAPGDIERFASEIAAASLVVSTDTSALHLAAAFERPQLALFGPTNPFHWRPRHQGALVISAARPHGPLEDFEPRMKGAPMERISTTVVCRAIDALLSKSLRAT